MSEGGDGGRANESSYRVLAKDSYLPGFISANIHTSFDG
jgi:hypothetical protein